MQARSLDPVAHPRAIQPLDQNTEVRLKDNYYVVSHRDKSVKMCDNLLLFLFIWDISGHVSKSYYFQRVRATHNIMHVIHESTTPNQGSRFLVRIMVSGDGNKALQDMI